MTDSSEGSLQPLPCLGVLPGSCCPHYSKDPERRPAFTAMVQNGELGEGIAIDDGCAAHYVDGRLSRIVSAVPDAAAYRVRRVGDSVVEEPFEGIDLVSVLDLKA